MVGFTHWSIEPTITKANNIFEMENQIVKPKSNGSQANFVMKIRILRNLTNYFMNYFSFWRIFILLLVQLGENEKKKT